LALSNKNPFPSGGFLLLSANKGLTFTEKNYIINYNIEFDKFYHHYIIKMNPLIIILGVVVVFLAYQLYSIYTSAPVVASNLYLGSITSQLPPVSASSISSPTSSQYTIGFWIYINTFSSNINEFIAFCSSSSKVETSSTISSDFIGKTLPNNSSYNINVVSGNPKNVCTFSMDDNTPTLYANITTKDTVNNNQCYIESIPITTNMPIQTWTYVVVAVSSNAGNYADCYINGKLLVSQQLKYVSYNYGTTTTSDKPIVNTFVFPKMSTAATIIDVYLTKITWIGNPIDPQTAWYYYNQGNGNPSGPGTMSSYHLEVDFTKDSNVYKWNVF